MAATQKPKKRVRARKAGDLKDALKAQWQALHIARQILLDAESSDDKRLRAVHAVNQCAGIFAKLYEATNLEARVAELEKRHAEGKPDGKRPPAVSYGGAVA